MTPSSRRARKRSLPIGFEAVSARRRLLGSAAAYALFA
jgi:hypothetical protein